MSVKDPLIESVKSKTTWYIVLRPFDGNGESFVRGQVVDTKSWRHTSMLEQRRYIAPLPYGAEVPEEIDSDGVKRRVIVNTTESADKKVRKKK